ncbi:MAG: hypothetical protein HY903_10830 [Deltaproteobacteria bacterium]|nr:hypothetical protein [Deltaproteobacteria bacterium]
MRIPFVTLMAGAACAPAIPIDDNERHVNDGPVVAFDPAASVIPFPNDWLIKDGKVSLPRQCGETPTAKVLREQVLNKLDGFGAYEVPLTVTFSEPVDASSLEEHVVLIERAVSGVPTNPATAAVVPVVALAGTSRRFDAACDTSVTVDDATLVPRLPLSSASTYAVVILDGVRTADGRPFNPSTAWAFARQPYKPVEIVYRSDGTPQVVKNETPLDPSTPEGLATIEGIATLWSLSHDLLTYLDVALAYAVNGSASPAFMRGDILLAWELTTQTTTAPLDPEVAKSPAAQAATLATNAATVGPVFVGAAQVAAAFYDALQPLIGVDPCLVLRCDAVGAIVSGQFESPSFQIKLYNPAGLATPVPGPWNDVVDPGFVANDPVTMLGFVPASEAPPAGYPTVIFGHGLGRSKEDLFALATRLAAAGIASVAIDWVDHGSRAVQTGTLALAGCGGTPEPQQAPQCFAPILSNDLPNTRDNLRQTVLDTLKLTRVLEACGTAACPGLPVDKERLGYIGQSLGALLGVTSTAVAPGIKTAVLNVGGVGWVDVFTETETDAIRCPIIDSLIDAGILTGTKWLGMTGINPAALCLTDAWRTDPGFAGFAMTARWILDPAYGANFVRRLADSGRPVLVQEVIGDSVVPNVATEALAGLLALDPIPALLADSLEPTATPEVTAGTSAWLQYDSGADNTFAHGSLLAPADNGDSGMFGTAQMQTDAVTFLSSNL